MIEIIFKLKKIKKLIINILNNELNLKLYQINHFNQKNLF